MQISRFLSAGRFYRQSKYRNAVRTHCTGYSAGFYYGRQQRDRLHSGHSSVSCHCSFRWRNVSYRCCSGGWTYQNRCERSWCRYAFCFRPQIPWSQRYRLPVCPKRDAAGSIRKWRQSGKPHEGGHREYRIYCRYGGCIKKMCRWTERYSGAFNSAGNQTNHGLVRCECTIFQKWERSTYPREHQSLFPRLQW